MTQKEFVNLKVGDTIYWTNDWGWRGKYNIAKGIIHKLNRVKWNDDSKIRCLDDYTFKHLETSPLKAFLVLIRD